MPHPLPPKPQATKEERLMTYRHPSPNLARSARAIAQRFVASIKPLRGSHAVLKGNCGLQGHQLVSSKHSFYGQPEGGRT